MCKKGRKTAFTITALQNNTITIALRGPDKRNKKGQRYKKWVKYTDFRINGKKILSKPIKVWHDKPYKYKFLCWGKNKVIAMDKWAIKNKYIPNVVRSYSDSKNDMPIMKIAKEQIWINPKTGLRK